jgi:hypothetical protein
MAVESFYFSHDYNARSDRKLVKLQMSMGMHGIGIFWCIVEMLYEEGGYIMQTECERIAFELRTDSESIKAVLENYQLFEFDNEKFWSESVLRRLELRSEKSKSARESALARWNKSKDANALQTHDDRNAIKESKGKEIKESKEDKPIGFIPFDFFGVGVAIDHRTETALRDATRIYFEKGEKKYSLEQWEKFFAYWEAKTKRGKMKWMGEPTFDIPQRIRRFGEPIEEKKPRVILYP